MLVTALPSCACPTGIGCPADALTQLTLTRGELSDVVNALAHYRGSFRTGEAERRRVRGLGVAILDQIAPREARR